MADSLSNLSGDAGGRKAFAKGRAADTFRVKRKILSALRAFYMAFFTFVIAPTIVVAQALTPPNTVVFEFSDTQSNNSDPATLSRVVINGVSFGDLITPDGGYELTNFVNANNIRIQNNGTRLSQFISAAGGNVAQGVADFEDAVEPFFSSRDLNQYVRIDNPNAVGGNPPPATTTTQRLTYSTPVDLTRPGFIVVVERGGNNDFAVRGLSGGSSLGLATVPAGCSGNTGYFDTGRNYDNGQDICGAVIPLSTFGTTGTLDQVELVCADLDASGNADCGDGKVFVVLESGPSGLPTPDSCTELTTSWSGSGRNWSSTTSDGVTVSTSISTPGNTNWSNFSNGSFNNIPAWSEPLGGATGLTSVMFWDTTPESAGSNAVTDAGTATFTVNFSSPVENPVLHIDRMGGFGGVRGSVGTPANSSEWTLTTPGADISAAAGTPHFEVNGNSFFRTPFDETNNAESSTVPSQGTAAGSIQVDGIYTSLSFDVTGIGTEGSGADGIEMIFCAPDAAPPVANDDTNAGVLFTGDDATLDIVANDTDSDGTVDPTTVSLIAPPGATSIQTDGDGDVIGFTVPGEGTWSVDPTTGETTFLPQSGFEDDPTPVDYTIDDDDGLTSNVATITLDYTLAPTPSTGPQSCGPGQFNAFTNPNFDSSFDSWTRTGTGLRLRSYTSIGAGITYNNVGFIDNNNTSGALTQSIPRGLASGGNLSFDFGWNNGNPGNASIATFSVAGVPIMEVDTTDVNNNNDPAIVTFLNGASGTIGGVPYAAGVPGPLTISRYRFWDLYTVDATLPSGLSDSGDVTFAYNLQFDDFAVDNFRLCITPEPELSIIKSVTSFVDVDSSDTLNVGDTVNFSFTAENTGNTALGNVSVTDTGLSPITLTPDAGFSGVLDVEEGPVTIASAAYTLTAADIANGGIENTAVGSADPIATLPNGDPDPATPLVDGAGSPIPSVTDDSDAGTEPTLNPATGLPDNVTDPTTTETVDLDGNTDSNPGNDPTVVVIPAPALQVTKSAASYIDTNANGVVDDGDTLNYSFRVRNTGNTDLTNVTVTDLLPGISISGSPIASLPRGATNTSVTASYTLQPADIDAGAVENSATATGTAVDDSGAPFGDPFDPGNPITVSDVSDTGTDADGDPIAGNEVVETPDADGNTDGNPTNDPTVFAIEPSPGIAVEKAIEDVTDVNANGIIDVGDTIDYAFRVTNTGNVDLINVAINDPMVSVSGGPISLDIGNDDTVSFSATYTIDADDVAAGGIENTAIVTATAADSTGAAIIDPLTGQPVTVTDDSDSGTEPLLNASGDPVTQASADTTETPGLDGSTDGDPTNDPTVLIIPNPELTLIKSLANAFDDNIPGGDGLFGGEGDTLSYRFTVTNTGNVDLENVEITDPTVTMTGAPINLDIGAGDSQTFTGTYTVTATDVAPPGFVLNSATATGDSVDADGNPVFGPTGTPLTATDVSDTGTDPEGDTISSPGTVDSDPNTNPRVAGAPSPDGEPGNDPTITAIPGNPNPRLSVIKSVASVTDTSGDGMIGEGDTVTYSFAVTNTGNLALADVTVTDALANVIGGPINLAVGATDTTTFTATSVITAAQATVGAIENTAEATGGAVNSVGTPILDPATGLQRTATDTSDAGTDPNVGASGVPTAYSDPEGNETPDADGNTDTDPTNDPTVLFLPMPEVSVVKSMASVDDTNGNGFTDAGDTINYAFAVTNSGNTDLIDVAVTDALPGIVLDGTPVATLDQGETDTSVTATYVLTAADIAAGGLENTAETTATAVDSDGDPLGDPTNPGNPLTVTDTSDAGTSPSGDPVPNPETTETPDQDGNTDGDPTNDPTVFTVNPAPALQLIKSVSAINDLDGDGLPGAGDQVVYSFTVTNVGNVDLADVTLTDPLGPVSGGPIDLDIGDSDSATFTLTHTITARNITDGAVENTATATGTAVDAGGNPFNNPITGGDLTTSDTSDAGTEPEISATGLPEDVTDPETTETADVNGNTDGDSTNDPTVLILPMPELTVVKSTSNIFDTNGDGLFGGEDDEVTYQFTVRNTGNVDIEGITLTDNLAAVSGGPIDLAAGAGDSVTFTASYTVTAADITRGFLENSAEVSGDAVNSAGDPLLDLNGNPISVTDTSDTGTDPDQNTISNPGTTETPDGSGATDGDPTNDPTVTSVPANPRPQIEVIKSVASVTDNGDGQLGAGDTVTYSFVVTNTGNVDLGNVTVTDALVPVTGGPITLALGASDSTTFSADYVLTASDVTAGGVENTATAAGGAVNSLGDPILDGPGGNQLIASDDSDAGTEPEMGSSGTPQDISDPAGVETPGLDGSTDGDLTNDPTVLTIPTPGISVIKSLASAPDSNGDGVFGGVGDVINYSFVVTNTGNTTLDNIFVTDATANVTGGPISLDPGERDGSTFTATYTVTFNDVNTVGYVENTANVFADAVSSNGNPIGSPVDPGTPLMVTDTSDTGTDRFGNPVDNPEGTETDDGAGGTDGDPTNDPTVTQVPAEPDPSIEVIKSVANVVDTDGDAVLGGEDDTITYRFIVTNTGNTFLADVEVVDPLLGGLIGTIPVMAVGDTVSFTVDYVISEDDQARGYVENTATAEGEPQNPLGTPLLDPITLEPLTAIDDSDAGTDAQTDPISDPGLTETTNGTGGTDGDPTNDPTVVNVPLAVPDTGINGIVFLDENENGVFDEGDTLLPNYIVRLVDEDGDIIASTTTDANGFYQLSGFPIGTIDVEFVDPNTGDVVGGIDGLVFARNTVLTDQNQALDPVASPDQLVLTKTTPLSTVVLGGSVPYQITAENQEAFPVTANIVDTLPTGFVYLPDSATINGTAVEPTISGQNLTWSDVVIGVGETVTLELVARVGPNTPVGDLTNIVRAFDPPTGDPLAPPATATVRRNPEAVFDCSDIIGKVFDDRNFDGYQNGIPGPDRSAITDQDIFVDGKAGKLTPPPEPEGEPGLPRVRLVTPTGTIVTTDEYGRYSIPCAELPGGFGTNFTLKLDDRSLPTGYRVTTENPRTMRVTAGIMTELNFGAALGRVVDIDLTAAAFGADNAPVDRLEQGIARILTQVKDTPSVLRISYFSAGEDRALIKDRLDQLEDTINARWRAIGDYRLIVERDVKYLQ